MNNITKQHQILYGDVWACLSTLDDDSIDCAITSPPYWSQRDYGFEGQIGCEKSLNEYIRKLLTIFNLLRSKLKPKGVFYLNIGDKYLSKYGNTPLGMIPYILVYYLKLDGWIVDDIQIWFKVNHMPSSVKNRFTNTYEPIFVLTKSESNYYSNYRNHKNSSNILKVPLQPVPYKHMATFPEKLIERLLEQGLPNNALILDPFAGSGTTCKAVQNISKGYFNQVKMSSILIESFKDYINIIKKRCNIKTSQIKEIPFKDYSLSTLKYKFDIPKNLDDNNPLDTFNIKPGLNVTKIFSDSKQFGSFIPILFDDTLINVLDDKGVLFLGLPNHDIGNIFTITKLNQKNWIIRNMIVVPQNNDWFPIFFIVKDIKSVKYKFNLDGIRIAHKQSQEVNWNKTDFIGYRVEKSQAYFKTPDSGIIIEILSKYKNGLPKWMVVNWNTSKTHSLEELIENSGESNQISIYCWNCKAELSDYYHYKDKISCKNCKTQLWQEVTSIPILEEKFQRNEPDYQHKSSEIPKRKIIKKNYVGKFVDTEKINLGQSPGARVSINEQFFSMQRYYQVKQDLTCDYLNLNRKKIGLTKKDLTNKYPPEYKHTCGHWLRKDMGGSLPKYEDLLQLKELLNLEGNYINYISRMGVKLQTVIAEKKGKNPGDLLDIPLKKIIAMLQNVTNDESIGTY